MNLQTSKPSNPEPSFDLAKYQDTATIIDILRTTRTVAIVGLSSNTLRASHFVGFYLQRHGYRVIPVNPREREVLGERSYPSLLDVPEPIDLVDVFRNPEAVPGIAEEAVKIGAKALWLQYGVISPEGVAIAERGGLKVVVDRCVKVEHARHLGRMHLYGLNTNVVSARRCGGIALPAARCSGYGANEQVLAFLGQLTQQYPVPAPGRARDRGGAMVSTQPGQRILRPLDLIGNTPLVELTRVAADLAPGVRLLAKAEMANPGGSVKDRPALSMIRDGIERGLLTPGKTILEATSGNTGIALAMIGTALGYRVELCLPENASPERKRILKAYGAEVILTSALESSDGAIREARRRYAESPDRYFYADQYSNPANWRAHYTTTAPEIWAQTGGAITHFVAGVGTSGTFVGTARRLREFDPGIRLIAMHPDGPYHGLEGMKHMASALVPAIYDPTVADEDVTVATEAAYAMVKRLAREEGLLVGISAGANVHAALAVARGLQHGTVVTILCDGADKYLSARFWDETD